MFLPSCFSSYPVPALSLNCSSLSATVPLLFCGIYSKVMVLKIFSAHTSSWATHLLLRLFYFIFFTQSSEPTSGVSRRLYRTILDSLCVRVCGWVRACVRVSGLGRCSWVPAVHPSLLVELFSTPPPPPHLFHPSLLPPSPTGSSKGYVWAHLGTLITPYYRM